MRRLIELLRDLFTESPVSRHRIFMNAWREVIKEQSQKKVSQ